MKRKLICILPIVLYLFVLSACENKQEIDVSKAAKSTTEESVKTIEEKAEIHASADKPVAMSTEATLKLGARSFIRCRSCHTLASNQAHTVGPNLSGLFSATAGKKEGFNYSAALADSGITWDAETLRAWLRSPSAFIPGNKMAFAGITSDKELEALLVYLNENTQ